jgi:hypothetical protein
MDLAAVESPHTRLGWIYRLRDPRDGAIRYIGKTERTLAHRLLGHLDSRTGRKHANIPVSMWLREMRPLRPRIEPVAVVPLSDEVDPRNVLALSEIIVMEQYWMAGHDLLNVRSITWLIDHAWQAYAQDGDVRGGRHVPIVPLLWRHWGGPPLPLGPGGRAYARQAIWIYSLMRMIRWCPHLAGRASVYTDLERPVVVKEAQPARARYDPAVDIITDSLEKQGAMGY